MWILKEMQELPSHFWPLAQLRAIQGLTVIVLVASRVARRALESGFLGLGGLDSGVW